MKRCLLIGSGYEDFRGYALKGLCEVSEVVLLQGAPTEWPLRYVVDSREVDLRDVDAVLTLVASLHRADPFDGVITWIDAHVPLAAALAQALGLPGMTPRAARACRDKAEQRAAFARADVPSAGHWLVDPSLAGMPHAVTFPVVVKPRSGSASAGVVLAGDRDELRAAVTAVAVRDAEAGHGRVLVEEYLPGYEMSVDAVIRDGRAYPFAIARKRVGQPPHFEEVGHVLGPEVVPPATRARMLDVVEAANAALGIDYAVTHTEVKIEDGHPRVIEVNGRLGGDLISYVAELVTPTLNVGERLVAAATEEGASVAHSPTRSAGIEFVYPVVSLRIDTVDDTAIRHQPWLVEYKQMRPSGDVLKVAPHGHLGRASYAIVEGNTPDEAAERLDFVRDHVIVHGQPVEVEW